MTQHLNFFTILTFWGQKGQTQGPQTKLCLQIWNQRPKISIIPNLEGPTLNTRVNSPRGTYKKLQRRTEKFVAGFLPCPRARFVPPASHLYNNASRARLNWVRVALSNSMLRPCQIEVKYAEGDADSAKSDAGGIISATRVAQTLHGDTAKNPHELLSATREFFCKSHAGN